MASTSNEANTNPLQGAPQNRQRNSERSHDEDYYADTNSSTTRASSSRHNESTTNNNVSNNNNNNAQSADGNQNSVVSHQSHRSNNSKSSFSSTDNALVESLQLEDDVHGFSSFKLATSLLRMRKHTLWFTNQDVERAFVYFNTLKGGYRFVGMHVGLAVAALLRALTAGGDPAIVAIGVTVFLYAVLASIIYAISQRGLRSTSSDSMLSDVLPFQFGTSSPGGKLSTTPMNTLDSLRRRKQSQKSATGSVSLEHCELDATKRSRLLKAQVCEVIAIVADICNAVALLIGYLIVQQSCAYIKAYDDRPDDEMCPFRIHSFSILVRLFPLLTGTPRFCWYVAVNVIFTILWWSVANFHQTSLATTFLTKITLFGFAALVSCLKWLDERGQRSAFAAQCLAEHQTSVIKEKSESLKFLIIAATPKHLYPRLGDDQKAGRQIQADVSKEAICLVTDIHNIQRFMTSMPPMQSVVAVAMFNATVLSCAEQHTLLCRVRTVGDTTFFVGNLFYASLSRGEGNGSSRNIKAEAHEGDDQPSLAAEELQPTPKEFLKDAVDLASLIKRKSKVPVRSGIGGGSLVGTPMGEQFSRYDIFGPALDDAMETVASCKPRHYLVSDNASRLCEKERTSSISTKKALLLSSTTMSSSRDAVECSHTASASTGSETQSSNEEEVFDNIADYVVEPEGQNDTNNVGPELLKTLLSKTRYNSTTAATSNTAHSSSDDGTSDVLAAHQTTVVVEANGDDLGPFTLQPCCGVMLRFRDASAEQEWQHHRRSTRCLPFSLVNIVMSGFTILLLCTLISHRHDSTDKQLTASIVMLSLSVVLYGGLATLAIRRVVVNNKMSATQREAVAAGDTDTINKTSSAFEITSSRCVVMSRLTFLLLIVGVQLSRPSIIGDDTSYLTFLSMTAQIHMKSDAKLTFAYQLLLLVLHYVFMMYRPLIDVPQVLFMIPAAVAIIYVSVLHDNSNKRLFVQQHVLKQSNLDVRAQERLRQSMVDNFVPTCLRSSITAESMQENKLDCSSIDDCVVINVRLHPNWEAAIVSGNTSPKATSAGVGSETTSATNLSNSATSATHHSSTSMEGSHSMSTRTVFTATGGGRSSNRTAKENDRAFRAWVAEPHRIREFNNASVALIDGLVRSLPNRSLFTVSIFGGSVIVAGPLTINDNDLSSSMVHGGQRRGRGNASASTTAASDTHNASQMSVMTSRSSAATKAILAEYNSAEDTAEFIRGLLLTAGSTKTIEQSLVPSARSVGFTCGVAYEQIVSVLRLSATPSYDLLGPAVGEAHALLDASPVQNTVVLSSKAAQLLSNATASASVNNFGDSSTTRNGLESSIPSPSRTFANAAGLTLRAEESWVLRNFGPRRVRRVELEE